MEGVNTHNECKKSLFLKDNYSSNKAVIHSCNKGTDIPALRQLTG